LKASVAPEGLGQQLRTHFRKLDDILKDPDFQYYHRLALAEAVMVREQDYLRTTTYLEFSDRYSSIKSSLEPAKTHLMKLTPRDPKLFEAINEL
jgi:hypothetical protein